MIEEHLDDIVSDVKTNLTSLFNRGAQFNELTEKSENLKTHVSTTTQISSQLIYAVRFLVINHAKKSTIDQTLKRES